MKQTKLVGAFALLAMCQGGWAAADAATSRVHASASNIAGMSETASLKVDAAVVRAFDEGRRPDVIVTFAGKADLSRAQTLRSKQARGLFTYDALTHHADRAQAGARQTLAAFGRRLSGLNDARGYQVLWLTNSIAIKGISQQELDALRQDPNVVGIREQIVLPPLESEATPDPGVRGGGAEEPHLVQMHVPEVWALGHRGEGIVVGSTDGGVRHTHEALVNQYRGNVGGGNFDHNYNWFDPYQNSAVPRSSGSHGQHTMGTSVGDDGGDNRIGVAPDARWIACIGFGGEGGGATDAGLIACGQFALAPTDTDGNNPDPTRAAHVVNNSWGSTVCNGFYDDWYEDVVDGWIAAGIVPVFSIGNASNCSLPNNPPPGLNGASGQYGKTFAVGSTGLDNGEYAPHSIKGPTRNPSAGTPDLPSHFGYPSLKPNIVAPGVNIRSAGASSDSDYFLNTGTSMSAPAVTGLVALIWSAADCLVGDYATTGTLIMSTANRIPVATGSTADGIGDVPNQATGWGEIDALAAVNAGMAHCADPAIDTPLIRVTRVINFEMEEGDEASETMTIENVGIDQLNWSVDEAAAACDSLGDVDWLDTGSVNGNVAAGGAEAVSVTANASGQSPGDYAARLCVASNDGGGNALAEILVRLVVRPKGFVAPFPAPYCAVVPAAELVPITNVSFAGIDNRTTASFGADVARHEDFTKMIADVVAGETYEMAVEINTRGGNRMFASAFIDWNRDDVLNTTDEEFIEFEESLINSNGDDGQQITAEVVVPADIEPGLYRLRVLSQFNRRPFNSCGTGNGQAEEYLVRVGDGTVDDLIFADGFEKDTPAECKPLQLLGDPSFETTTSDTGPNDFWTGFDSEGDESDTPFWSVSSTTLDDAHDGSFVAWGGGWGRASNQTWSQSVMIPAGSPRFLNFWRFIDAVPASAGTLTASIDGTEVSAVDVVAAGTDSDWTGISVDVSAFADGDEHEIQFEFDATGGSDGNTYVDSVTLDCESLPAGATHPVRVSPGNGNRSKHSSQ